MAVMGPKARDILQPICGASLANEAFPFGTAVTNHMLANSQYRHFVRQNSPLWWDWAVFANEAKWYANEGAQGFVSYQDADAMIRDGGRVVAGSAVVFDELQTIANRAWPGSA